MPSSEWQSLIINDLVTLEQPDFLYTIAGAASGHFICKYTDLFLKYLLYIGNNFIAACSYLLNIAAATLLQQSNIFSHVLPRCLSG